MLCPHCGRENTQEAVYCVGCGASLPGAAAGAGVNAPAAGTDVPAAGQAASAASGPSVPPQPSQDASYQGYQQPCGQAGYQQPYGQPGCQQPYGGPAYQQPYAPHGQAGYQVPPAAVPPAAYAACAGPYPPVNRNIVVCILLSIVTCGIYGLYWIYRLVNELNTASGHPQDTSGGLVILFSIITCGIYGIYWYYKAGEKVAEIRRRQTGAADNSTAILYLVLALFGFGIVNDCLIQSELNNLAPLA